MELELANSYHLARNAHAHELGLFVFLFETLYEYS